MRPTKILRRCADECRRSGHVDHGICFDCAKQAILESLRAQHAEYVTALRKLTGPLNSADYAKVVDDAIKTISPGRRGTTMPCRGKCGVRVERGGSGFCAGCMPAAGSGT